MAALAWMAAGIALAGLAALAAAAFVVISGVYNVAATSLHNEAAYFLLHTTALNSIERRAASIEPPRDLEKPDLVRRGLGLFRQHCVTCHGGPGVAREAFAMGLEPGAPDLAEIGRDWSPAELYWTTANGIKMSAMPAWKFRLSEADLWALVAFLRKLPTLSPREFQTLPAEAAPAAETAAGEARAPADVERGRIALQQYGCPACHAIPGIAEAQGKAGPPLSGIASRRFIAGLLPNDRESLVEWLRRPQAVKPGNAMPDLGVSLRDARDMAAYLETLR